MKTTLILVLLGLCSVWAAERCGRGQFWSEWSECKSPQKCTKNSRLQPMSYPVKQKPGPDEVDVGRMMMDKMIQLKLEGERYLRECRARRTCPDYVFKQSEGRQNCEDGMAGEFPCRNINQTAFLDFAALSDGHSDEASDIWGWTDPETGDEYALVGLNCGTSFIRMTDPENPVVVAYLETAAGCAVWRDLKVNNDHVFIVADLVGNHGLQVVDLNRLRDLDSYTVIEPDVTRDEFGSAHNIVANEDTDYIYVVGSFSTCRGGLLIYDVSDPSNPEYITCYGDDGYVHDAQCIVYNGPDTDYQGREICLCFNEDTFTIVDVTDKDNMIEVAREGYQGSGYTHQGWITEDHTIVLMDDEGDEFGPSPNTKTYVWDVTDLDAIELKNTHVHELEVTDHNQYIKGSLTFQSNYLGGLRVLHLDQETYELTEVGYFDNAPGRNDGPMWGSWSNYPYFESGYIPMTGIETGFYIVEPNIEKMMEEASLSNYAEQTRQCPGIDRIQTKPCEAPQC